MILVDPLVGYPASMTRGLPGRRWCHMVSDLDEAELHAFAARIGLKRAWAQLRPEHSAAHYDLTPSRRARAVAAGAVEVTARELVMRNFDGLRRRGLLRGHWVGPNDGDLKPDESALAIGLPPERWPYGGLEAHEDCCKLRRTNGAAGSFCDCAASDASDTEHGEAV